MQNRIVRLTRPSLHAGVVAAVSLLTVFVALHVSADPPSKKKKSPASKSASVKKPASTPESTQSPVAKAPTVSADTGALPDRHLERGQLLARTAMAYRGIRYRWGGRSEQTGFDCSGLVQTVCAKWGIYLPRLGRDQYKMGVSVPKSQMVPGDLVFFKNTYKRGLSHVGIYIGDGWFIHAPSTGKTVSLTRIDDDYHAKHWAGARRLDLSKLPAVAGEDTAPKRVVLDESLVGEGRETAPPSASSDR